MSLGKSTTISRCDALRRRLRLECARLRDGCRDREGAKLTIRWHIIEDDALVLTRLLPPRFDVVAETHLPPVARRRGLAHQIRQDVWRALRRQKGFSPVIEIRSSIREEALRIRAGGRVDQAPFSAPMLEARIAAILADPARRARWITHANRPRRGSPL